jgi:hypothetical protein
MLLQLGSNVVTILNVCDDENAVAWIIFSYLQGRLCHLLYVVMIGVFNLFS